MGVIYEYLWALLFNVYWLTAAVLFFLEQLIGLLFPRYREWVDQRYSKGQRWKCVKTIIFGVVLLSGFFAWKEEHEKVAAKSTSPAYAEVSKDGTILLAEYFDEYGLSVEKIEFRGYPAYQLTFEKAPHRIRVEPQANATRDLVRLSSNVYRVRFVGAGFGNLTLECNFAVEAFGH